MKNRKGLKGMSEVSIITFVIRRAVIRAVIREANFRSQSKITINA